MESSRAISMGRTMRKALGLLGDHPVVYTRIAAGGDLLCHRGRPGRKLRLEAFFCIDLEATSCKSWSGSSCARQPRSPLKRPGHIWPRHPTTVVGSGYCLYHP